MDLHVLLQGYLDIIIIISSLLLTAHRVSYIVYSGIGRCSLSLNVKFCTKFPYASARVQIDLPERSNDGSSLRVAKTVHSHFNPNETIAKLMKRLQRKGEIFEQL
jgi:hypothetical protein